MDRDAIELLRGNLLELIDCVPKTTEASGESYASNGRVEITKLSARSIKAVVGGRRTHKVRLSELSKKGNANYHCDCMHGRGPVCKHVYATVKVALQKLDEIERQGCSSDSIDDLIERFHQAYMIYPVNEPRQSKVITYRIEVVDGKLGIGVYATGYRKSEPHWGQSRIVKPDTSEHPNYWTSVDQKIVKMIRCSGGDHSKYSNWHSHVRANLICIGGEMETLLELLKNAARVTDVTGRDVVIHDEPVTPVLAGCVTDEGGLVFRPELKKLPAGIEGDVELFNNGPVYVKIGNHIFPLDRDMGLAKALLLTEEICVTPKNLRDFLSKTLILMNGEERIILPEELYTRLGRKETPTPKLFMSEENGFLRLDVRFSYPSAETDILLDEADPLISAPGVEGMVYRDLGAEEKYLNEISGLLGINKFPDGPIHLAGSDASQFLVVKLSRISADWKVYGRKTLEEYNFSDYTPHVSCNIKSGADWFELSGNIEYGGEEVSLEKIAKAIKEKKDYVLLSGGEKGMLPLRWAELYGHIFNVSEESDGRLKIPACQAGLLAGLSGELENYGFDVSLERLTSFTPKKRESIPGEFKAKLRPYQKQGFDWLCFLYRNKLGGCLADDMGLGKTVQAICLLQKMHEENPEGPALVIVPTSLISNWLSEFHKFSPALRVNAYHGIARDIDVYEKSDVIVTTYGILRKEIDELKSRDHSIVILDESQNIKNPASLTAKCARQLNAKRRLALTGTPIENSLIDLWSQYTFLNPGMLGNLRYFREEFAKPIQEGKDPESMDALKKLIGPFMLRRKKEDVASEIPEKTESIVYCEMDETQRREYDLLREHYRRRIFESVEEDGLNKSKLIILEGLMRLRQMCCNPTLIDQGLYGKTPSCKTETVLDMIETTVEEGHRILVYSQFVKMLHILRDQLRERGIEYEYLDGNSRDRGGRVRNFQESSVPVFLISLKAGGFGLNLTGADYVIHYDPWWNPAVEAQATDRTHRIGQEKNVFSYRYIVKDSVEEKVLELQERKKTLVKDIISADEGLVKDITEKDLKELFG